MMHWQQCNNGLVSPGYLHPMELQIAQLELRIVRLVMVKACGTNKWSKQIKEPKQVNNGILPAIQYSRQAG